MWEEAIWVSPARESGLAGPLKSRVPGQQAHTWALAKGPATSLSLPSVYWSLTGPLLTVLLPEGQPGYSAPLLVPCLSPACSRL